MNRYLPTLLALALVVTGAAWYFGRPSEELLVTPVHAEDITAEMILPDHVMGSPDAPVTIVEYASYTCGHCSRFHADQLQKLKAEYIDTGKVRFIHREVYFDKYGLWGGLLAACGGEMRYHGLARTLYAKQGEWLDASKESDIIDNLTTLGKTAGLTEEQVEACLMDQDMATKLVATYQHHAGADGINATPTLIIDGEKHSNMGYPALKAIIEARLAE